MARPPARATARADSVTRPPAGPRSAGRWPRRRSRPGDAGPPSTSSIACSCPRPLSNGPTRHDGVAQRPRGPRGSRASKRDSAMTARRLEVARPARRTSAAPRRPSRCRARRRRGRDELGVDLGLGVAAHRAGDDPRSGLAVAEEHAGHERVQRPLARREHVRVVRVEREVAAAVLVVDAGLRIDDAGAEAQVVRLDEADRVAVGVDRGEVGRAAAGRVGGGARHGGPIAGRSAPRAPRRGSLSSSRSTGMSRAAGSVRCASRSAIASLAASIAEVDPAGSAARRPGPNASARRRLELLEDVEQLQRDDARRVRRVGRDPHAAIGRLDRLAPVGRVRRGSRPARMAAPDAGEERRLPLAEVAVVEGVEAVVGEALRGSRRAPAAERPRPGATAGRAGR